MTCSVNHSTITTKFCSICGAPATAAQAPVQPPQWNQPPAAAPQWNQPPAQPYMPPAQPYVPAQPFNMAPGNQNYPFPIATTGKRVGGFFLDYLFQTITCGFSFIWTLIVMKDGQSPAKQVLKMRVYGTTTGRPATWGHMAIRGILIPLVPTIALIPGVIAAITYEASYDYYYDAYIGTDYSGVLLGFGYLVMGAFYIADLIMVANSPTKQGLKDKFAKTVVLDESYRY